MTPLKQLYQSVYLGGFAFILALFTSRFDILGFTGFSRMYLEMAFDPSAAKNILARRSLYPWILGAVNRIGISPAMMTLSLTLLFFILTAYILLRTLPKLQTLTVLVTFAVLPITQFSIAAVAWPDMLTYVLVLICLIEYKALPIVILPSLYIHEQFLLFTPAIIAWAICAEKSAGKDWKTSLKSPLIVAGVSTVMAGVLLLCERHLFAHPANILTPKTYADLLLNQPLSSFKVQPIREGLITTWKSLLGMAILALPFMVSRLGMMHVGLGIGVSALCTLIGLFVATDTSRVLCIFLPGVLWMLTSIQWRAGVLAVVLAFAMVIPSFFAGSVWMYPLSSFTTPLENVIAP